MQRCVSSKIHDTRRSAASSTGRFVIQPHESLLISSLSRVHLAELNLQNRRGCARRQTAGAAIVVSTSSWSAIRGSTWAVMQE
eukprot:12963476-Alexandrium_andersonii.AAC.1